MAVPTYQTQSGPFHAASNADLAVVLPTVTAGWLMLLVVCDFAVGVPVAPAGWAKVTATDGVSVFSKTAVTADSGATVTVAAFSTQTGIVDNTAYVLAYSGAVGVDKVSGTAGGSSGFFGAPGVRPTTAVDAVALDLFATAQTTAVNTPGTGSGAGVQRINTHPSGAINIVADAVPVAAGVSYSPSVFDSTAAGKYRTASLTIVPNRAPTAPTLLSPAATADLDRTAAQTFTWLFNDPDPGDSQSKYDFGLTDVTAGGTEAVTTVSTATASNTIAANTLTSGHTYSWRVRTYDASGTVGAWSAGQTFTAAPASAAPTFTSPTTGSTVTTPTITATLTGVGFGLRWRRVADNAGSPNPSIVYADSGPLAASSSFTVTFDTNGRDEHLQASSENSFGIWSPYVDVLVHVAFTQPPAPTVTLTTDWTVATITATWTTPAPTGGQPAVDHVDLYVSTDAGVTKQRLATGLTASGSWVFETPASGIDYSFQIVTVAADGALGASAWTS